MEKKNDDILLDDWEDELLEQLIQTEEQLVLTSKPHSNLPSSSSFSHALPTTSYQPPPHAPLSFINADAASFSPPRELSQRPTTSFSVDSPSPHSNTQSDKDLEIERLKTELEHATKQIANLEKDRVNLKKERDKKEDQLKFISSKNEKENACTKCSKSKSIDKDFGTLTPNLHKISSKFQNGVSANDPIAKGVDTDMVTHREAQDARSDDLPAYLNLSQKLLAIWGCPTVKKMGNNVISKLLVGCQRDFHILFGCMNMSLPSEITRELLSDINSSGVNLHNLKDHFHTPEAAKMSNLYLALMKIADGTNVLETLIEPLLDLCGMENIVIVHSSLCVLHMLLKLLLELEKNVGRSALCSGTMSSLKDFALGRTSWILV